MLKKLGLIITILTLIFMVTISGIVFAEGVTLNVIGHRVHKLVATEGKAGDIIRPWIEENDSVNHVEWLTFEIEGLHDRLFRECSLPSTDIDVGYLLSAYTMSGIKNLLQPLDHYLEVKPIEGFPEEFPEGVLESLTFDGQLYGIPIRSAATTLEWNEMLFKERGLDRPPKTPEELYEFAKKLTFTREDGTKVYGFFLHSHHYLDCVNAIARMYGGGFISPDYKVICDEPPAVKAVNMIRKMYEEGIIPKNTPSLKHVEKQQYAQQNRTAMSINVPGNTYVWNEDLNNIILKSAPLPAAEGVTPHATTQFWSLVIPANSKHKDLAWEFVRYLSSSDSALKMALNRNTPTRKSVFDSPEFIAQAPYASILKEITLNAQVDMPAFDESAQALDLIDEYIESVMLGYLEPQIAMDELAEKLKNLSEKLK